MFVPLDQFRENIVRVRDLVSVYKALKLSVTPAIDLSDVLRSALVLAVSAFDHYVHEIVRIGMLAAFANKRPSTATFLSFQVSTTSVKQALAMPSATDWLDLEIRRRHGYRSFQHSTHVAEAIRLISDLSLWDEVAQKSATSASAIKEQINLIVDRRNKIAHEADMDPGSPGSRGPIDEALVEDSVSFLESVALAIDSLI
jgi:hypothetical protein